MEEILVSGRRAWPWLLWLLLSSLPTYGVAQSCNNTTSLSEVNALHDIYRGFVSIMSGALPGWTSDEDPCGLGEGVRVGWGGVVCTRNGNCSTTVTGLYLQELELKGSLSSSVELLRNLTILNIAGNPGLVGSIPGSIKNLTNLVILDLSRNGFTDDMPPCGTLKSLQSLDYSDNQLTGPVPAWLGDLKQLQRLDLSNNKLNGSLPVNSNSTYGLRNLQNLVQISFSNNNLTGTLDYLNTLPYLKILNGSNNHFNGTLLPLLQNTSQLNVLDLSSNEISGGLPTTSVPQLQRLSVANNTLNGNISPNFLGSPNLTELTLDNNDFSGSLNLASVPVIEGLGLQLLSAVNNNITGVEIAPTSLLSASSLTSSNLLFLGGNPYCNDPQSDLQLRICRFNSSQILTRRQAVRTKINTTALIVVVTVAGVLGLLVAIAFFIVVRRFTKRIKELRDLQREFVKNEVQPNLYSYTELKAATEDFSSDNRLGQGGFGVVYKGTLPDDSIVAVKQLTNSEQGLAEFLNEIVTISGVKHRNLVKLKGCCIKGDQRMLVYEYVENKNLAEALWDSPNKGGRELDWSTRFNIILGIARGLAYLHEEVTPPIIHRDIKAANILLDKNLDPKIGDFGLALLFPALDNNQENRTHLSVNIAGTKGYLSPEYASFGQVSEKADVFSFGVLVLEIISGRKNIALRLPAEQRYILEWAWKLYEAGTLQDLIDPKLVDRSREEDIKEVILLGLACVQYSPAKRPTMSNIVSILLGHQKVGAINRDGELSKDEVETMFATMQTASLTPVNEDSPLLVGLPTASASGAFIELGKLKPR